jgi:hypothetical protein
MLFCQLAQAKSLREITEGLQASEGKLKHLGLPEAPARSTLAYANSHRPWQLFETVFQQLLADCQKRLGVAKAGAKLGLPGKLLSLDATVIDLCAAVFDWAQFRTTKGAVKLHLLLDHDGYLPCYAVITEGKVHEIQVARKLKLQPGTMLVFDRGYADYDWFQRLTEEGVHFVTRLKDNATYIVVERRKANGNGVRSDEIMVLEKQARSEAAPFLRRIRYWDEANQRELVFLTNHLELQAATVAAIYKERWQIELLFKALKQNLRIKTFVGTTANALKTQIWTALIALLAVKFLQLQVLLEPVATDCTIETAVVRLPGPVALAGIALRAADGTYCRRFAAVTFRDGSVMTQTAQPGSRILTTLPSSPVDSARAGTDFR